MRLVLIALPLVSALVLTKMATSPVVHLRVNTEGIFIGNYHLTTWANFQLAEYVDATLPGKYDDRFELRIYYDKPGEGNYIKTMILNSSFNHTEEEILAAIRYFYQHHKSRLASGATLIHNHRQP